MKTLIAAIGALALATGVAEAQPYAHAAPNNRTSVSQNYDVAGGSQTDIPFYRSHTVNQGAGTSRSSDANQG